MRREAAGAWSNPEDFVFTNELGHHLYHSNVYRNFKRIVASIGMPETRFHDLRHSYAIAALQSGDDIKTLQENLGHHTAAFTLNVYGHVSDKGDRKAPAAWIYTLRIYPINLKPDKTMPKRKGYE